MIASSDPVDIKRPTMRVLIAAFVLGLTALAATPAGADDDDRPVTGAVFVGTNHNNTNADPDSEEAANQVSQNTKHAVPFGLM